MLLRRLNVTVHRTMVSKKCCIHTELTAALDHSPTLTR